MDVAFTSSVTVIKSYFSDGEIYRYGFSGEGVFYFISFWVKNFCRIIGFASILSIELLILASSSDP